MPTTNTRSTKTKSSSSTRESRAKASRGGAEKGASKSSSKTPRKQASMEETNGSNGHSQLEKLFTDTLKDI